MIWVRCLTKRSRPGTRGLRLGLLALGHHKAHGRALSRLADRLGIRRIVLLARDEGLHVSRRDQSDRMPELADLASPIVGAAAGFHRYRAGRLAGKEGENLVPPQLLAEQDRA
jgi:uncharacterized membrane protein